tara:strand:- start:1072 stop:1212 length:141 start_codon:yes stop_codon:yes gene_type:complete
MDTKYLNILQVVAIGGGKTLKLELGDSGSRAYMIGNQGHPIDIISR